MRFLHGSDWHGKPERYKLGIEATKTEDFDLWIISGDMLPNCSRGRDTDDIEGKFQVQWVDERPTKLKKTFGDKKVLVVDGNHDYISFARALRENGIDAHDLYYDGPITIDGVRFAGFPFVKPPPKSFRFKNVAEDDVIRDHVQTALEYDPHVLVTHGARHGVLDMVYGGERIGSESIANAIDYGEAWSLIAMLHGHVHEDSGIKVANDILYSNAACALHRFDVTDVNDGTLDAKGLVHKQIHQQ